MIKRFDKNYLLAKRVSLREKDRWVQTKIVRKYMLSSNLLIKH